MLKKSLYVMCTASLLSAATTMCYKKDHIDPSTIESISLDGGKCAGKLSVADMQKDGYQIDSMKLQDGKNGFNYIYIFSKNTQNTMPMASSAGVVLTDAQLTARLEKIQAKQKVEEKKKQTVSSYEDGKKLYESKCRSCHGDGTIQAYNRARPLKNLSVEQMEVSIRRISNGTGINSMSILMKPYADALTSKEINDVYTYLNSVK